MLSGYWHTLKGMKERIGKYWFYPDIGRVLKGTLKISAVVSALSCFLYLLTRLALCDKSEFGGFSVPGAIWIFVEGLTAWLIGMLAWVGPSLFHLVLWPTFAWIEASCLHHRRGCQKYAIALEHISIILDTPSAFVVLGEGQGVLLPRTQTVTHFVAQLRPQAFQCQSTNRTWSQEKLSHFLKPDHGARSILSCLPGAMVYVLMGLASYTILQAISARYLVAVYFTILFISLFVGGILTYNREKYDERRFALLCHIAQDTAININKIDLINFLFSFLIIKAFEPSWAQESPEYFIAAIALLSLLESLSEAEYKAVWRRHGQRLVEWCVPGDFDVDRRICLAILHLLSCWGDYETLQRYEHRIKPLTSIQHTEIRTAAQNVLERVVQERTRELREATSLLRVTANRECEPNTLMRPWQGGEVEKEAETS
jgi:hypothetical protein